MTYLIKALLEQKRLCEQIIEMTNSIKQIPKTGWIEISSPRKKPKFYRGKIDETTKKRVREYIPVAEHDEIHDIFESDFLNSSRQLALEQHKLINHFLSNFKENGFEKIYENLHPVKKSMIAPLIESHQQFLEVWKNSPYEPMPFRENTRVVSTRDGNRVRSKTERTLYEIFQDYKIPFKYECPLHLRNKTIYPDFTFIHPYEKSEIYWEHFGMMDDPEYSVNAYLRINEYANNGIFIGENLIVSFEHSMKDLDYTYVKTMIEKFLLSSDD